MKKILRWVACAFGNHENALCITRGYRPLFPVVCDTCRELFYMPPWTDAERAAAGNPPTPEGKP